MRKDLMIVLAVFNYPFKFTCWVLYIKNKMQVQFKNV
jgi:hypothetical protein